MTGHQQNPTTGYNIKGDPATKIDLEALCRALGFNRVRVVDPYDLKATEAVIMEEIAANEPSVIISRRPCALLKYVEIGSGVTEIKTGVFAGCSDLKKVTANGDIKIQISAFAGCNKDKLYLNGKKFGETGSKLDSLAFGEIDLAI
jgi:indolepyruvate ferredoxin oxidoreductase alpha subunit